jgi:putative toxin-antitoxin system antitoxin component (TIGR02293 family)
VDNKTKSVVEITMGVPVSRANELVSRIRKGLPFAALERLQKQYRLSRNEFIDILAMSRSTARRRETEGKLSIYEGDKILRYARLLDLTLSLMDGNRENALQWLLTPNRALNGEAPSSYAVTEIGAEMVSDLIGKIEHGVFI